MPAKSGTLMLLVLPTIVPILDSKNGFTDIETPQDFLSTSRPVGPQFSMTDQRLFIFDIYSFGSPVPLELHCALSLAKVVPVPYIKTVFSLFTSCI